jgi:hypothetical protein
LADPLADDLERWLEKETDARGRRPPMSRRQWAVGVGVVAIALGLGLLYPPFTDWKREAILREFRRGETLTLVGEQGGPRWYRFRTEVDRQPLQVADDNPLELKSHGDVLLVELFPAIHGTGFRLCAEVQHIGGRDGHVGVYFGHLR